MEEIKRLLKQRADNSETHHDEELFKLIVLSMIRDKNEEINTLLDEYLKSLDEEGMKKIGPDLINLAAFAISTAFKGDE